MWVSPATKVSHVAAFVGSASLVRHCPLPCCFARDGPANRHSASEKMDLANLIYFSLFRFLSFTFFFFFFPFIPLFSFCKLSFLRKSRKVTKKKSGFVYRRRFENFGGFLKKKKKKLFFFFFFQTPQPFLSTRAINPIRALFLLLSTTFFLIQLEKERLI